MKKLDLSNSLLIAMGLSSLLTISSAQARNKNETILSEDKLVCYKWSIFPNERWRLNVKWHSALSTSEEENTFGDAGQDSYSVHGKEIGLCGGNSMTALTGTVIRAEKEERTSGSVGAHLSLQATAVRAGDVCRPIEIDCTTEEQTRTPKVWNCHSRNQFNVFHGASTLTLVDDSSDPRCGVFQDGTAPLNTQMEGTGSGLNRQLR